MRQTGNRDFSHYNGQTQRCDGCSTDTSMVHSLPAHISVLVSLYVQLPLQTCVSAPCLRTRTCPGTTCCPTCLISPQASRSSYLWPYTRRATKDRDSPRSSTRSGGRSWERACAHSDITSVRQHSIHIKLALQRQKGETWPPPRATICSVIGCPGYCALCVQALDLPSFRWTRSAEQRTVEA